MKNKSYIGISFIILIFGIWAIPKIIAKLKELNQEHLGAEKANENMREHLIKSVTMNENLIEQIGTLLQ